MFASACVPDQVAEREHISHERSQARLCLGIATRHDRRQLRRVHGQAPADHHGQRRPKAKGVAQSFVSMRLKLAELPQLVRDEFIKNTFIKEGHALEIIKLSVFDNLSPWLDRAAAMQEVIEIALKKGAVTAKDFQTVVNEYNAFITAAKTFADAQDGQWRTASQGSLTTFAPHGHIARAPSRRPARAGRPCGPKPPQPGSPKFGRRRPVP